MLLLLTCVLTLVWVAEGPSVFDDCQAKCRLGPNGGGRCLEECKMPMTSERPKITPTPTVEPFDLEAACEIWCGQQIGGLVCGCAYRPVPGK